MTTMNCSTLIVAATLLGACGGNDGGGGGTGTCNPGPTATITIRATGVTPKAVCVVPTGTVTFTNSDTAPHDIESGATCPQLNLGVIAAGGSQMATLPTAAVCPFHDQLDPTNTAFQGTVAVSSGQVGGPGY